MPNLGRVGVDSAGGLVSGPGSSNVFCNGAKVCLKGDAIEGHGISPHNSPTMTGSSSTVFCNGIPVCRAGDQASCSHTLGAGSSNVLAG